MGQGKRTQHVVTTLRAKVLELFALHVDGPWEECCTAGLTACFRAPLPERDKHYLLVHVILTGLTGCAHPERVRGVTCDQPGPRIPQNISLTSAARANDASQKVEWWFDTCCPNFGSRKGKLDRGNRDEDMLHIILSHIVELILFSFQSIPIFSLPAFGAGAYFERN